MIYKKAIYLLPYLVLNVVCHGSKEATPVDTDSSISNCCNLPGECGGRFADGKEVEVIDLENDSGPEDNALPNSERKYVSFINLFSILIYSFSLPLFMTMVVSSYATINSGVNFLFFLF